MNIIKEVKIFQMTYNFDSENKILMSDQPIPFSLPYPTTKTPWSGIFLKEKKSLKTKVSNFYQYLSNKKSYKGNLHYFLY